MLMNAGRTRADVPMVSVVTPLAVIYVTVMMVIKELQTAKVAKVWKVVKAFCFVYSIYLNKFCLGWGLVSAFFPTIWKQKTSVEIQLLYAANHPRVCFKFPSMPLLIVWFKNLTRHIFFPDLSRGLCFSQVDNGLCKGTTKMMMLVTRSECCCTAGKAWGSQCIRCPSEGTSKWTVWRIFVYSGALCTDVTLQRMYLIVWVRLSEARVTITWARHSPRA